jgi:glycerol-3-phosphate acyltransferase PlsX
MNKTIILSIDAMGGSNAPYCVIEAIDIIHKKYPYVKFDLYCLESSTKDLIPAKLSGCIAIHNCETAISDEEQPVKALKIGKQSTMYKAIEALKIGRADACVSGGNTGALMVMSKMILGSLSEIKRPAIVSIFPNLNNGSVMLDLGANAECDPSHLFQFALMGSCFARIILQKNNPSIGILNVGVERYKGRDLEKKTFDLLNDSDLNFHGFVEGHDLTKGTVDVVVTDGFSGNIVIKTAEGTAKVCKQYFKDAFHTSWITKIAGLISKNSLKKALSRLDPRKYNGAMFIGVDGIVVKSHGSSDAVGFANALEKAIHLVEKDINKQISSLLSNEANVTSSKDSLFTKIKNTFGFGKKEDNLN